MLICCVCVCVSMCVCAFVCVPDSSPYLSWLRTTPSPVCVKIVINPEIDRETEAERKGHTCIEIVANTQKKLKIMKCLSTSIFN